MKKVKFKKPKRYIQKVYLHCSASDSKILNSAHAIDTMHKKRGWSGIGYHFFVTKEGKVEKGRDLEKIPAAQKGHNQGSIAICNHGLNNFTKVSLEATKALCIEIYKAYDGAVTFHGHCEVSAKECPVYDYKGLLELNSFGEMSMELIEREEIKPKAQKPKVSWFKQLLFYFNIK
jgi:N-acetylmuramoyl-L-alanine amidase